MAAQQHSLLLGAVLLALGSHASASTAAPGSTAHLSVNAQILPAACVLTLNDDAHVGLGDVRMDELQADRWTALPVVGVAATVACQQPTNVVIGFTDETPGQSQDVTSFRLWGRVGEDLRELGAYFVRVDDVLVGNGYSTSLFHVHRPPGSSLLYSVNNSRRVRSAPNNFTAFGLNRLHENMSFTLAILPHIFPLTTFDGVDTVQLEGRMSMELVYL